MLLFRTLINRNMWANPLSNVMGDWWIWREKNGEKQLTTLRLGTWQLLGVFYNTLGGGIGGLLYYVFHKVKQRNIDK